MKKILHVSCSIALCLLMVLGYACKTEEKNPCGSIYGMVSVAGTAEPMRGTGVELYYLDASENCGALLLRTTTADDGSYSFEDVRAGKYLLRVEVPGYKRTEYKVVVEGGRSARADMQVKPMEKSIPSVKTNSVTNERIEGGRATLNGTIIDAGNPSYTERGFIFSRSHNPMLEDADITKVIVPSSSLAEYTTTLTGMELGLYYVRAYAINEVGVAYGMEELLDLIMDIAFVHVDGGTFDMGCMELFSNDCIEDELPVRRITLDSYDIGAFEITQKQWEKVMGSTVQDQGNIFQPGESLNGWGADYPMYCVSWEEAQIFCKELGRLTGNTYRLPTEAEWEYAARGGKKCENFKYSGGNSLDLVGWYQENGGGEVHPVGSRIPNSLGIYDMTGNVWEWCQDWGDVYDENDTWNPQGPSGGQYRVCRGGSYACNAWDCRVTRRIGGMPSDHYGDLGFRIVRVS